MLLGSGGSILPQDAGLSWSLMADSGLCLIANNLWLVPSAEVVLSDLLHLWIRYEFPEIGHPKMDLNIL